LAAVTKDKSMIARTKVKPCVHVLTLALFCSAHFAGCKTSSEGAEGTPEVEKLPDIKPDLPEVPQLRPPPHPIRLGDGTYSVFGIRKKNRDTIDKEVAVTGVIVKIYQPEPCAKGADCPAPLTPHVWIADEASDPQDKWLKITDYADNQEEVQNAIKLAQQGRYKPPPAETGLPPIPTDFAVGAVVKIKGRFTYVSSRGFNDSRGLLEYLGHETIKPAA